MSSAEFDYIASNGAAAKIRSIPGSPMYIQVEFPQLNGPDLIIEESVAESAHLDVKAIGVRMIEDYLAS